MGLATRFSKDEKQIEVGCDEAGRGPLFGRVYTGAVIWPSDVKSSLIRDSKKLSQRDKIIAYDFIRENAVGYSTDFAEPSEIDEKNILNATMCSMHRAIHGLYVLPDIILADGTYFPIYMDRKCEPVSHVTIPKGDDTYYSIAAASILAKVEHDKYIIDLCDKEPMLDAYNLRKNKGYGSADHIKALEKHGRTKWHRNTFKRVQGLPMCVVEYS